MSRCDGTRSRQHNIAGSRTILADIPRVCEGAGDLDAKQTQSSGGMLRGRYDLRIEPLR